MLTSKSIYCNIQLKCIIITLKSQFNNLQNELIQYNILTKRTPVLVTFELMLCVIYGANFVYPK